MFTHLCEKGWYLGGEPIITRAELQHYDSHNVVVAREDKTFSDLGMQIILTFII